MITVEHGRVNLKGTRIDLMAETTCLLHTLLEKGVVTERDLDFMASTAKESDDRLKQDVYENLAKLIGRMFGW